MFQELKKDPVELCLHIAGWMCFTGWVGYAFDIYPFRKIFDNYFVIKTITTTIVIEHDGETNSSTERERNIVTTEQ